MGIIKTVIIGNSGSGKTWLAERLARGRDTPVIHLDNIFWQPGGFDLKRPTQEVASLIDSHLQEREWVVEGVFGNLAQPFLDVAQELVWLDLPWAVCEDRLRARGSESKRHMDLYARFPRRKLRLCMLEHVTGYLSDALHLPGKGI